MAVAHTMADIDKIKMGINLQNMDITLIVKRIDAGDIDGMIPANYNWQRASGQNLTHAKFNVGMAFISFRMDDIGITQINDTHIACEVCRVILMVIGTGMTERK